MFTRMSWTLTGFFLEYQEPPVSTTKARVYGHGTIDRGSQDHAIPRAATLDSEVGRIEPKPGSSFNLLIPDPRSKFHKLS